jgi:hypothetical protein
VWAPGVGAAYLAGRGLGVPGVLLAVLVVDEAALSRGLHSRGNACEVRHKRRPPEGTPRLCGPRSAQGIPTAARWVERQASPLPGRYHGS